MDGGWFDDLVSEDRGARPQRARRAPSGRGDHILAALRWHIQGGRGRAAARPSPVTPLVVEAREPPDPTHRSISAPNWLFWSVATAAPLTSGLAWVYLAVRTRRWSFLAEAIAFVLWPLVGFVGVTALVLLTITTDTLLTVGFDIEHEVYRHHAADLRAYHDDYQLNSSPQELGLMDQWQTAYDDMNERVSVRADSIAESAVLLMLLTWGAMWVASVVHAQRVWFQLRRQPLRERVGGNARHRSGLICFLLWAVFGLFGAHRYYLGRWMSGLLYMLSLGGLGVGWAIDVFLLRSMLETANHSGVANSDELAPWAVRGARFGFIDFLMRLAFFIAAPGLFTCLCVSLNQVELLLVMVFAIVFCGLLGNVKQWLERLDFLGKTPLLRPVISVISQLYAFYYEHRPRPFLSYVFAPLTAPISLITSPSARREFALYFRFLITILGAVVLNELRMVSTTYRYHSWTAISLWVVAHLLIATAVTSLILTPIITTTFAFNLSGRSKRLRLLSAVAILVMFVCGVTTAGYIHVNKEPTFLCYALLRTKLRDQEFQTQLTHSTQLFLEHYIQRTPKPLDDFYPMAVHPKLTELYRNEVLVNLTPESEAKVFRVFSMDLEGDDPDRAWLGVGVLQREDDYDSWITVCMLGPTGEFYSRWDEDRPLRIREEFELAKALWSSQVEHRLADRSEQLDRALYAEAKRALLEHRPDPGVNEATYLQVLEYLSRVPAEAAAARSPATFDPAATAIFRRRVQPLVGHQVRRFRVFHLPRILGKPWHGVTDGRRALCLLTPDGDFIARWDLEIYHDLHNVRLQFERLDEAVPQLLTSFNERSVEPTKHLFVDEALRQDLRRERAEQFLRHYVNTSTEDNLDERYRQYVAKLTAPPRLDEFQVRGLPNDEGGRWLAVYRGGEVVQLMSPRGDFFTQQAGRLRDLIGAVPRADIERISIARAPGSGSSSVGDTPVRR